MITFPDSLRSTRAAAHLSQLEAADRLRISRRALQYWEDGKRLPIYPAQVGALHLLAGNIIAKPPGI